MSVSGAMAPAIESTPRCAQCGLGVRPRAGASDFPADQVFCCYGCALMSQIAGSSADRGEPSWILARLGLAAFLSMNVMALSLVLYPGEPAGAAGTDPLYTGMTGLFRYVLLLFSAPVPVILGWPILANGLRGFGRRGAGVDSLIAAGAMAAFGLSAWNTLRGSGGVYFETACMVLVLVTLGRYLEARARSRAAEEIGAQLSRETGMARVMREGLLVEVSVDDLVPGDIVRLAAGARVPADGEVLEGEGGVDESSLTGEALPVRKSPGARLLAGTTSLDGAFLFRVTAAGDERMAARIARLLDDARASRAPIELRADRIAAAFLPAAGVAAACTAAFWTWRQDLASGLMNGLSVLLIACPCALGLATPLAVWRAIGRAAKRGIVIRSGAALERLASVRTVFFDKTGTLTDGKPRVARIVPVAGATEEEILQVAAALETACAHPLAGAILSRAAERGILPVSARNVTVHPGVGVRGDVDLAGSTVDDAAIGGAEMLRRMGIKGDEIDAAAGPAAYLTAGGRIMGSFYFEERLRAGAAGALAELRRLGLGVCVLTGDSQDRADHLALGPGVEVRAGLSPSGKMEAIAAAESHGGRAVMVGEGLNDAPALARCSVSVSLGCGDGVSKDASDISLLDDDVARLPWLVKTARNALRAIHVNLFWAFAYNLVLIPAAMTGRLQPLLAALAMIGSSLFVAGNSLRAGGPAGQEAEGGRGSRPAVLRTMEVPTT